MMYLNYKFEMIPVVVGCLGYIQNDLKIFGLSDLAGVVKGKFVSFDVL